ncbi:MAG: amidohydrolase family protein [Actinomycetes bacterium]
MAPTDPTITVHTASLVLPVLDPPIPAGAVAMVGGRILDRGPAGELLARYPSARRRDWPGWLIPGLVNAHAHLQYSAFADLAALGADFPTWIATLTARRRGMTGRDWTASTRVGIAACLRAGVTAVADVVTDPVVLGPTARSGLAGLSYLEVVAVDEDGWAAAETTLVRALESAPRGRVLGISPHSLYTLGHAALVGAAQVARSRGLRLHLHLAETDAESRYVATGDGPLAAAAARYGWRMALLAAGGSGLTPAGLADELGLLGPDVHVAHGVHAGAADRARLRRRGTAVAVCARSNRVLATGDPPVAAFLDESVPLALGTDSLASSPDLDLLAEARAVRGLARAQGYDAADLSRLLVEAATIGGARALGLSDCGHLRPGARADLAVVDVPTHGRDPAGSDPYSLLLDHGPYRVLATVLGGRLVYRHGRLGR